MDDLGGRLQNAAWDNGAETKERRGLELARGMIDELKTDMSRMEDVMSRTATRADIWQDRCVYWMAVAIGPTLEWIVKHNKES